MGKTIKLKKEIAGLAIILSYRQYDSFIGSGIYDTL
jgi:hypothetical protein